MCFVFSAFGSFLVYVININTADLNLIANILHWNFLLLLQYAPARLLPGSVTTCPSLLISTIFPFFVWRLSVSLSYNLYICLYVLLVAGFELTFSCQNWTTVNAQCDAENTRIPLISSTKNMPGKVWPFKSCIFCRIHRALNYGSKGLIH